EAAGQPRSVDDPERRRRRTEVRIDPRDATERDLRPPDEEREIACVETGRELDAPALTDGEIAGDEHPGRRVDLQHGVPRRADTAAEDVVSPGEDEPARPRAAALHVDVLVRARFETTRLAVADLDRRCRRARRDDGEAAGGAEVGDDATGE